MKNLKKSTVFISLLCVTVIAVAAVIGVVILAKVKTPDNNRNDSHNSQAAVTAPALFKTDGTYNDSVTKASVVKGAKFSFFGYDWAVVAVNGNTATFWMTAPYTTSHFNYNTNFGTTQNINNTWSSGYNYSTWNGIQTATSTVRQLLLDKASDLASQPGYGKIVSGPQTGLNDTVFTEDAVRSLYRKTSIDDTTEGPVGLTITPNFSIGAGDKLWLPSWNEVKNDGTWNLTNADRNWTGATNTLDQTAWLRTPKTEEISPSGNPSYKIKDYTNAYKVGCSTTLPNGGSYDDQSIWFNWVDSVSGVRPAVHLNISDLDRIYTITWKNYSGTTISTSTNIAHGTLLSSIAPTTGLGVPADTAQYSYTLRGWATTAGQSTGTVWVAHKAEGTATYYVAYSTDTKKYTVTWKNGSTILKTDSNVEYGANPSYTGAAPTKAPAGSVVYTFIGWKIDGDSNTYMEGSFPSVTGNITFNAEFIDETVHTVLWMNGSTVLERDVIRSSGSGAQTATYNGTIPVKQWHTFSGWSSLADSNTPDLSTALDYTTGTVTADMSIYAVFVVSAPTINQPPAAMTGLIFNGTYQALTSIGTGINGTVEYCIGLQSSAGENWSEEVPTVKNAGTYYVWYRVSGVTSTGALGPVEVTVAAKAINTDTLTVAEIADQPYKGEPITPSPAVITNNGILVTGSWEWATNNAIGTATGVFTPDGNFFVENAGGIVTGTFNIVEDPDAGKGWTTETWLRTAFIAVCVVGVISIICVAVVCSKKRIREADNSL
jgi:hypothetical protein